MTGPYATAVIVVSLVLAVWAFALVALDRLPSRALLVGGVLLELSLIGFAVGGIVQMVGTDQDLARAEFVGYLLTAVLILPAAAAWGLGERSRSGTAVLAVAFLVMPIVVVRVQQVWAGPVVFTGSGG